MEDILTKARESELNTFNECKVSLFQDLSPITAGTPSWTRYHLQMEVPFCITSYIYREAVLSAVVSWSPSPVKISSCHWWSFQNGMKSFTCHLQPEAFHNHCIYHLQNHPPRKEDMAINRDLELTAHLWAAKVPWTYLTTYSSQFVFYYFVIRSYFITILIEPGLRWFTGRIMDFLGYRCCDSPILLLGNVYGLTLFLQGSGWLLLPIRDSKMLTFAPWDKGVTGWRRVCVSESVGCFSLLSIPTWF